MFHDYNKASFSGSLLKFDDCVDNPYKVGILQLVDERKSCRILPPTVSRNWQTLPSFTGSIQ